MTTTEFIKYIKDCQEGRKNVFLDSNHRLVPIYIITESELEKIEKVNVELLKALISIVHIDDELCKCPACKIGKPAIKNASN